METLTPQAAYTLWAPTYPAVAHNPLMRVEQDIVQPLLARLRGRRALDVGTGSGRYLPVLASTGARVVGIDLSMAMLARCAFVGRLRADACALPFRTGAFDIVNASLMVGDIADLDGWCREMSRVLASGGHLVYSDFHPSWTTHGWRRTFTSDDGTTHDVAFSAHSIEEHLSALERAGFRVDTIREPRLKPAGRGLLHALIERRRATPVIVVFHAIKDAR